MNKEFFKLKEASAKFTDLVGKEFTSDLYQNTETGNYYECHPYHSRYMTRVEFCEDSKTYKFKMK